MKEKMSKHLVTFHKQDHIIKCKVSGLCCLYPHLEIGASSPFYPHHKNSTDTHLGSTPHHYTLAVCLSDQELNMFSSVPWGEFWASSGLKFHSQGRQRLTPTRLTSCSSKTSDFHSTDALELSWEMRDWTPDFGARRNVLMSTFLVNLRATWDCTDLSEGQLFFLQ